MITRDQRCGAVCAKASADRRSRAWRQGHRGNTPLSLPRVPSASAVRATSATAAPLQPALALSAVGVGPKSVAVVAGKPATAATATKVTPKTKPAAARVVSGSGPIRVTIKASALREVEAVVPSAAPAAELTAVPVGAGAPVAAPDAALSAVDRTQLDAVSAPSYQTPTTIASAAAGDSALPDSAENAVADRTGPSDLGVRVEQLRVDLSALTAAVSSSNSVCLSVALCRLFVGLLCRQQRVERLYSARRRPTEQQGEQQQQQLQQQQQWKGVVQTQCTFLSLC